MTLQQGATLIGLILAVLILLLRLSLSFADAAGTPVLWTLVGFFSFFTILTNLCLALIYASDLWRLPWLDWFRSQRTRTMMAGVIMLVMAFYHVLLSGLWAPEGLHLVADVGLHYVAPVFYVLWWWIFSDHGGVRFMDIPMMLLPSLIYVIYTLLRGAVIGTYPYPIFEVNRLGYQQVALNIVVVAVALGVLFALFVFADRKLAPVPMASPPEHYSS